VLVEWIHLTSFRSYPDLRFEPEHGINVLVGANAAGKTNVLESIGYLGTGRSFRRVPDADLVGEGSDAAVLRGEVELPGSTSLIEVEIPREGRRRMQVNRNRVGRTADLAEHLRTVVFQPDDLDVVKRSPSYRRAFLDEAAVQLWPVAHQDLAEYERSVRQRNALLKQMGRRTDRPTLEVWNQRVAVAGARVMARRVATMAALGEPAERAYEGLAGGSAAISFAYQSSWGSSPGDGGGVAEWEARLWEALEASSAEDMDRRVTTVGPHRDDPALHIDGRDTRTRVSQGEQRSLVLALRLAQQEAISARLGHPAVMLLDDVFSELDGARAAALASALPPGQAFISTARDEEVPLEGRRWSVRPGSVT
jgi:DNA replication and repair protein RecF